MNTLQHFGFVLIAVSTIATSTQALSDDLFDKHDNQKKYSVITPFKGTEESTKTIVVNNKKMAVYTDKGSITSNGLVRTCESTARGIRCKNNTTLTANFIAALEKQGDSRYQTKAEKSCNNSSRGTRCMGQTKEIGPIYIASAQQLTTKHNSCQTKSRGSRCFS